MWPTDWEPVAYSKVLAWGRRIVVMVEVIIIIVIINIRVGSM